MKIPVLDKEGKKVKELELPKEIFNVAWNPDLVHQVMTVQFSNERQNLAHTKDRSEVRGGGKKPWRQKGTGRARHGSRRSPIWIGGGVTFGPRSEKNFKKSINKKMKRKAVLSVLSKKAKDSEIVVLEKLSITERKTKQLTEVLRKLPLKRLNALIALPEHDVQIKLAGRNINTIKITDAPNLNVVDLLKYKYVVMPENAIDIIGKTFIKK
ncbi:50S ribosomal protein L4 [Candidatus Parcubacteria bacterium]|nr:MAG: 50S ribosomal protein L4 [Candidatus Parcubacteria bacterium]